MLDTSICLDWNNQIISNILEVTVRINHAKKFRRSIPSSLLCLSIKGRLLKLIHSFIQYCVCEKQSADCHCHLNKYIYYTKRSWYSIHDNIQRSHRLDLSIITANQELINMTLFAIEVLCRIIVVVLWIKIWLHCLPSSSFFSFFFFFFWCIPFFRYIH